MSLPLKSLDHNILVLSDHANKISTVPLCLFTDDRCLTDDKWWGEGTLHTF